MPFSSFAHWPEYPMYAYTSLLPRRAIRKVALFAGRADVTPGHGSGLAQRQIGGQGTLKAATETPLFE